MAKILKFNSDKDREDFLWMHAAIGRGEVYIIEPDGSKRPMTEAEKLTTQGLWEDEFCIQTTNQN